MLGGEELRRRRRHVLTGSPGGAEAGHARPPATAETNRALLLLLLEGSAAAAAPLAAAATSPSRLGASRALPPSRSAGPRSGPREGEAAAAPLASGPPGMPLWGSVRSHPRLGARLLLAAEEGAAGRRLQLCPRSCGVKMAEEGSAAVALLLPRSPGAGTPARLPCLLCGAPLLWPAAGASATRSCPVLSRRCHLRGCPAGSERRHRPLRTTSPSLQLQRRQSGGRALRAIYSEGGQAPPRPSQRPITRAPGGERGPQRSSLA